MALGLHDGRALKTRLCGNAPIHWGIARTVDCSQHHGKKLMRPPGLANVWGRTEVPALYHHNGVRTHCFSSHPHV